MAFLLHPKTRQAVEHVKIKKNSIILIGVLFYVYASNFAFTQFNNDKLHHPFLMHGMKSNGQLIVQDISKSAYSDYGSKALAWVVFLFTLAYILPEYREVLFIITFLFLGYLVEFVLIYNDPAQWVNIAGLSIPLGISTVAGVVFFIMLVIKLVER